MRFATGAALAIVLLGPAGGLPQRSSEPFVPIGVWYGGGTIRAPMVSRNPAAEREAWRRDLAAIKALGFNSIRTWIDWGSGEPERGQYHVEALEQLLFLAGDAGLRVIVQIYTDPAPEWIGRRYPDSSFVSGEGARIGSQASPGYCLDHAGVRADMVSFIGAVSAAAARHQSFYAIDVGSEPHVVNGDLLNRFVQFCYCRNTQARFREWLKGRPDSALDRKTFVAAKLEADLKLMADASAPRGARPVSSHSGTAVVMTSGLGHADDWWMSRSVDHYGTSIYPKPQSAATAWAPVRLAAALDGIRSAARDKGWWIGELQAGPGAAAPVTGADLRLWGWASISRGARAISYSAWYPTHAGDGLIAPDGTITDRARIAGEFAGIVSRNAGLFGPLRPHRSRVAILDNRLSSFAVDNTVTQETAVRDSTLLIYRALFEQNIQADFIHPDEVSAGAAARYDVVYLGYPVMLQPNVADALKAYVRGGGTLISAALPAWNDEPGATNRGIPGAGLDELFAAREGRRPGDPAAVISRHGNGRAILFDTFPSAAFEEDPGRMRGTGELLQHLAAMPGVTPEIRIDGAPGVVEARFLESSDAILLIAINHGDTAQRVTFTFGPDVPEAIWQNMETGAAVNFVQDAAGPKYAHTFAPRDVMVLVRGKRLR